jgi:cysteine desulfuration protein SufE
MADVRSRSAEVVEEFADLDGREKLELLVEYAAGLPRLPAEYEAKKAAAEGRIHECQTPVFMWMTTDPDGGAALVADVAPEAPTVKGFVAMLRGVVGGGGGGDVAGRPATEVADIPDDLVERIGLADVLGMLRARGLRAITTRVKRGFQECA